MTDVVNSGRAGQADDRSTAELVKQASEQISRLIRDELKLAQAELAEKGKRAGIGAGLLGAAGALSLYGLGVLITTAILALALVVDPWLAALIVGVVLFALAGILALRGRKQLRRATPALPVTAVHSVRADVDAVAHAWRDRRHS